MCKKKRLIEYETCQKYVKRLNVWKKSDKDEMKKNMKCYEKTNKWLN